VVVRELQKIIAVLNPRSCNYGNGFYLCLQSPSVGILTLVLLFRRVSYGNGIAEDTGVFQHGTTQCRVKTGPGDDGNFHFNAPQEDGMFCCTSLCFDLIIISGSLKRIP
jgi:hypothetical protein